MEVTKQNFNKVFPTLSDVFNRAQFLSFDTEFTGLRVEGSCALNYYGTLEDLYARTRCAVETFMAVQIGIVAFFYDEETKTFTHQAYNFYVYPSTYSNINFTCQSKSVEFLVQNGFDFNKVFSDGIPYLKDQEIDKLLEKLEEKHLKNQIFDVSSFGNVQNDALILINDVTNKIEDIMQNKKKMTFVTQRFTGFARKLICSEVQKKYGSKVHIMTNKDETMTISVGFSDKEIQEKKMEYYLNEKNKILDEAGFCKVIRIIMETGKLLVGHNVLIDIMYTIRQFLTSLPETYTEFKELTNFLFPKLLDTKHLARSSQFKMLKDTSLPVIIDYFCGLNEIPEVEIVKNGFGYNLSEKKFHEAAFDAYLSGLAFLAMSKKLGNLNCLKNLTDAEFLKSKLNKLSVPVMHDITFMNLGGIDEEPDRKGIYHIKFPKDWKKKNIVEVFENYGFLDLAWIDSTSAFVKVKYEFIRDIEKNLINSKSDSDFKLCTYSDYRKSLVGDTKGSNTSNVQTHIVQKYKNQHNLISNNQLSVFNLSEETARKRNIEDIGEVIERPQKKQSVQQ